MAHREFPDLDAMTINELKAVAAGELRRRARISAAKTGVPQSSEHRRNMSAAQTRRWARERAEKVAGQGHKAT